MTDGIVNRWGNGAWNPGGCALVDLRRRPGLAEQAAAWFHAKWGLPAEAYLERISAYLNGETEYSWRKMFVMLYREALYIHPLKAQYNWFQEPPFLT